jgi:hypothetical protein
MTDKEMLEYAAKAIGLRVGREPNGLERGRYDLYWSLIHRELVWHDKTAGSEYPEPVFWNPLTDDGDALRLAVRLGLHARQFPIIDDGFDAPLGMVEVWRVDGDDPMHVEFLRSGDDRLAATRRAIVRAAAEVGRKGNIV